MLASDTTNMSVNKWSDCCVKTPHLRKLTCTSICCFLLRELIKIASRQGHCSSTVSRKQNIWKHSSTMMWCIRAVSSLLLDNSNQLHTMDRRESHVWFDARKRCSDLGSLFPFASHEHLCIRIPLIDLTFLSILLLLMGLECVYFVNSSKFWSQFICSGCWKIFGTW